MQTRKLGRSGIDVSAMGMGCWAIGGPFSHHGAPQGWGDVDDEQSIAAVRAAMDMGVTFFDTADTYGCGHSERVLARALGSRRDQAVIATKFGFPIDERTKEAMDPRDDPEYVREACEGSLRRLNTECIDLLQYHHGGCDVARAPAIRDALEDLVAEGKIRAYGWSTGNPERAAVFAKGPHCAAVQHQGNVFGISEDMLGVCESADLASICRGPLAMGALTGKYTSDSKLPANDVRSGYDMTTGWFADSIRNVDKVRSALTCGGRTLVQGALAWLWSRSRRNIPIPGFRNVQQARENAGAMAHGPLEPEAMAAIAEALEAEE